MAPAGATGKPVKGSGLKPVVPVFPLTYQQRKGTNKQASKTVASSKLSSVASPPQPQPVKARLEVVEKGTNRDPAAEINGDKEVKKPDHIQASTPPIQPEAQTPVTGVSPSPPTVASKPNATGTPKPSTPASIVSEQEVVTSPTPTRRFIAPSFHGENKSNGSPPTASPSHDMASYPPHVPPVIRRPMHQNHPSDGSLVFGGFHDSNASSPVPNSNGGFPPPNFVPLHPTAMPAVDNYGRPFMVSPSVDGFPPAVVSLHGPPTPHSFQGSQSSRQENGHVQCGPMNSQDGYAGKTTCPPPLPMSEINPHMTNAYGPQQSGSASGPGFLAYQLREETLHYMRDAFGNYDFSDCVLEVMFPKAGRVMEAGLRASQNPLRIPIHRFVVARSPRLLHLMRTESPSRDGVLRIEIHDEYIRPDSFDFTIRTLYGWDLGDGLVLPSYHQILNIQDDFHVGVAYMATARYLQLPLVFGMALQRVTRLVDWDTLEQAYMFVFPGVVYSSRNGSPREEFSTADLLECVLAFMTNNIAADFVLDTQSDNATFSRLPMVDISAAPAAPPSPRFTAPAVVGHASYSRSSRDSQASVSGQHRSAANPRLSHIKFGDMSPAKHAGQTPNGYSPQSSLRRPTTRDTIISRILLNLPFALLKRILEHPALGKHELVGHARYKLFVDVVTEREARRQRALVKGDGKLQHLHNLLERAVEPLNVAQPADFLVNNMGFKEEVYQGDYPYLVHTWTGGDASSVHS